MPNPKLQEFQKSFLRSNATMKSVPELSRELDIKDHLIYDFFKNERIPYKRAKAKSIVLSQKRKHIVDIRYYEPDPPVKQTRWPAVYSNKSPYGLATELQNLKTD